MKKQYEDEDVPIGLLLYLELCKRIYERMERDNSWPWIVDPNEWETQRAASQKNPSSSEESPETESVIKRKPPLKREGVWPNDLLLPWTDSDLNLNTEKKTESNIHKETPRRDSQ